MKRISLIISFSILSCITFAQKGSNAVGLLITPNFTISDKWNNPKFGVSGGIFYDKNIIRKLSVSTSLDFTRLNLLLGGDSRFDMNGLLEEVTLVHQFDIIDLNVNIVYNSDLHESRKWKTHIFGGYGFGQIISYHSIIRFDDRREIEEFVIPDLIETVHFSNLGIEVKHSIKDKYRLSLGVLTKITSVYHDYYGYIYQINIFIKVGRLWNKEKARKTKTA